MSTSPRRRGTTDKTAAENEHRRLLVRGDDARADRLIVCGDIGVRKMPPRLLV